MIEHQFNTKKIIIYALIIFVIIIGYYYNNFNSIDNYIYDNYQRFEYLFNIDDKSSDITIVEINDLTLNKIGDWPIDRSYYVNALEKLINNGANIITFDILFSEAKNAQSDSLLLDKLRDNNNIIMPVIVDFNMNRDLRNQIIKINSVDTPLSSFKNLVKLGHINLIPDRDGIIRRLPPLLIEDSVSYLPISRQTAEMALNKEINITEGDYLINYQGPSNTINKVSFHDLLNDNYDSDMIKNKIIVIGVTAVGLGDQFMTSFSRYGYLSGVELQAQLINNYYNQNFIEVNDIINNIFIGFFVLALLFYLFEKFNPYKSFIILVLSFIFILSLNFYLTIKYNFFTEISLYLVGLVLIYVISIFSWYLLNRKQKQEIVSRLKPYFSDYVLSKLIENPDILKKEGQKTLATVMFFDFRNFTKFTEENVPEKVVYELNHSYQDISKIIFKYDGIIDKYLGDGLLVYWTKSLGQTNHRNRAVKAAIEIMNYMQNEKNKLKPSIAINTGQVILGDIGSKERMDFTIMGDVVNKTSKLVNVTKPYEIQVGENTYYGLSDLYKKLKWKYREIKVEGIDNSFVVYTLKDFNDFDKEE